MKFILIVVVALSNASGNSGGSVTQLGQFATLELCKAAEKNVEAMTDELGIVRKMKTMCVKAE